MLIKVSGEPLLALLLARIAPNLGFNGTKRQWIPCLIYSEEMEQNLSHGELQMAARVSKFSFIYFSSDHSVLINRRHL